MSEKSLCHAKKEWISVTSPAFLPEDYDALKRVLDDRWVSTGKRTLSLEEHLSNYFPGRTIVSTASCTAAQFMTLSVLGQASGGTLITTPLTWPSVVASASIIGLDIEFADIDEDTWCLNSDIVNSMLGDRACLVAGSHFAAGIWDPSPIRENHPNVMILEDAAHAFGAKIQDVEAGMLGDVAMFSFGGPKMISAGEGGVAVFRDQELAELCRLFKNSGASRTSYDKHKSRDGGYSTDLIGLNLRMTELSAALIASQLARKEVYAMRRSAIADIIISELKEQAPMLRTQMVNPGTRVSPFVMAFLVPHADERENYVRGLRRSKIEAGTHYPLIYQLPAYRELAPPGGRNRIAENVSSRIVTVPCHQNLTDSEVERMIHEIVKIGRRVG